MGTKTRTTTAFTTSFIGSSQAYYHAMPLRVAVVGAGAFGGWTALHLRRAGAEVTLVDAWGPGNARASSGGETRVIRTIYGPTRHNVEMAARALTMWTEWNRASGQPFY